MHRYRTTLSGARVCRHGLVVLITLTFASVCPAATPATLARALVKRVTDALPKVTFTAKMTLSTPEGARELELKHKMVGGARATYLAVTAPEDLAGIRFLFLERPGGQSEQYIKIAAARSAVRVADRIRKQPFLSSSFYVSDLVEPELNAFDYRFTGEQTLLGRLCSLVEALPKKPAENIYGKSILALDPKDLLILQRQFFDHDGKLLKVWTIDAVKKIDGFWTLVDQHMENVQEHTTSRLKARDVHYNVDLRDEIFAPKYLIR